LGLNEVATFTSHWRLYGYLHGMDMPDV